MDDLWRKAADEYPLNTGGADWNKLAARMGIPPEPARGKDRRYLLLLLLLLLPWMCIEYRRQQGEEVARVAGGQPPSSAATPGAAAVATGGRAPATVPFTKPATAHGPEAPGAPAADAVPATESTRMPAPASTTATSTSRDNLSREHLQPAVDPVMLRDSRVAAGESIPKLRTATAPVKSFARRKNAPGAATVMTERRRDHSNKDDRTEAPVAEPTSLTPANPPTPAKPAEVPGDPAPGSILRDTSSKGSLAVSRPDTTGEPPVAAEQARKKPQAARTRRLYIGLMAGAGVTSVEGQKVQRMGKDLGLVAGYAAGRHWAFEAGLLWSRKHYYSSGEYVKGDIYTPRYYTLEDVTGDCRMIEIPVAVQYHFGHGGRGNWFASAGISSYLMKREDYSYLYKNTQYNTEYPVDYSYLNATRDWAAQLQLSAGYRLRLPRSLQVRVEPYVQLPLKGAGWGKLPLTSAGLRLALTRSLF
ncbi:porin family protein [Flaviaesturariibacter flavus]|nr:porin family protein [Flaviaesturariibacter flavus]